MQTLVLNHGDVLRHLDALTLLSELREAFRADAARSGTGHGRLRAEAGKGVSVSALLPGTLPGIPAFSAQVVASAGARAHGALLLHQEESARLLAVMDAAHLLAVRSAVVCALAADVLAREDASRVALVGAGTAASIQLKCMRMVRSLQQVRVFDADHEAAFGLAARLQSSVKLACRSTNTVEEAVEEADLVIVTAAGEKPLVHAGMLAQGCHVTALSQLPEGFEGALFADGGEAGSPLGEVLSARSPGRTSPEQRTCFQHVGAPFEDLVAAWQVYQGALGDDAVTRMDLSA